MTLKELIAQLQLIEAAEGGDIEVTRYSWDSPNMPSRVQGVMVETVKPHYGTFFKTSRLQTGGYAGRRAFDEPYHSEISARPDMKVVYIS